LSTKNYDVPAVGSFRHCLGTEDFVWVWRRPIAGTGETRRRVCSIGGEGFVNQKRDSAASIIDWAQPVNFGRVKIASRMTAFGFGRLFEACFGALAWLVAPGFSFARGLVLVWC
jgi:hypothetical protein